MVMQIKSKEDAELLWLTGFSKIVMNKKETRTVPDLDKIALFFLVNPQTVRRWLRSGLPPKIRHQLNLLRSGHSLPPTWRKAGLTICHDGVLINNSHLVDLACIQFWPFIMRYVDWSRVPPVVISKLK